MPSRVTDDGLVIEKELGGLHRWRVLEVDEPRGREPTDAERAETATILTRPPMKSWRLTREFEPVRQGGPARGSDRRSRRPTAAS